MAARASGALLLLVVSCAFDGSVLSEGSAADGDGGVPGDDGSLVDADGPDGNPPQPVVVTLREGVGGYAGTQDTFIEEPSPDTNHGASAEMDAKSGYDAVSSASAPLLRFGSLVGAAGNQVPAGATVQSATLTINITDGSSVATGSLYEVLVDWNEDTVTWSSFGASAGMQGGTDYGSEVVSVPSTAGSHDLDVTASVARWVSGTTNYGWLLVPTNQNDRASISTSEDGTVDNRPRLSVTYLAP